MRVFRLCLTAGIVVMLAAMITVPAMASGPGKDGGTTGGDHSVGKDGGYDGGDRSTGTDGGDTSAGAGKDGGDYNDDNDWDDNDVGSGAGAGVPTTGAGGLAVAGSSGVMLFGGLMALFGAVWATGAAIFRQRQ